MTTVSYIATAPTAPALKCLVSYCSSMLRPSKWKHLRWLSWWPSAPLVFVFRGHWESRDRTNGQHHDGDIWYGQKCFGYHRYLPGKVNAPALSQTIQRFCFFVVFFFCWWLVFFLQPSQRGVQCDSGRRVLKANSHGMQHGGALQGVPAGVTSLLQWLRCLLHQRVNGQWRQFSRHQCQSQRRHGYAT